MLVALSAFLFVAAHAPAEPRTAPFYVAADVVRLRDAPDEGAAVVVRLRIDTPVTFVDERGPWVKVRVEGRETTLEGWTQHALLRDEPWAQGALLALAANAHGALRIAFLQRAAAQRGDDAAVWQQLAAAHREAGDVERSRGIAAIPAGRAPVHIAVCEGGRAILLAVVEGGGAPRPLTVVDGDGDGARTLDVQAQLATLQRIGTLVASEAWYGPDRLHGTAFLRPKLRAESSVVGTTYALDLGPCGGEMSHPADEVKPVVLARAPFQRASPVAQFDWSRAPRVLDAIGERSTSPISLEVGRIVREDAAGAAFDDVHTRGGSERAWALLSSTTGKPLRCARGCDDGRALMSGGRALWLQPRFGAALLGVASLDEEAATAGGFRGLHGMGESGYRVVAVDASGVVEAAVVMTAQGGC